MAEREPEQRADELSNRLHAAAEKLDHLRHEAADLEADLRNRLQALAQERQLVESLDGNRQRAD